MSLTKKGTARFLENYGTLQTDKYGISTATAKWHDHQSTPTLPDIGDAHPLWSELKLERINATHYQTHFEVEASYAGIFGTPAAVYELDYSVSEEPIESHPDFVTVLAGTAAAPLNDAKFDEDGAFLGFATGAKAGIRGYLAPGVTWRQTIVQATIPGDTGDVGAVDGSVPGSPPSVPSGRTWMYMGLTYEQRGGCFTVKREWQLSGRRGWDTDIYHV